MLGFYGLVKIFTERYRDSRKEREMDALKRGRGREPTRFIMWSLACLRKKKIPGGRKRGKTALPARADIFIQVNLI